MLFKRVRKRRGLFISLIVIVSIIIFLLITKGYLYFNFLIGNDISIKLSADKEYVFFNHNDETNLNFKASVNTNTFLKKQSRN